MEVGLTSFYSNQSYGPTTLPKHSYFDSYLEHKSQLHQELSLLLSSSMHNFLSMKKKSRTHFSITLSLHIIDRCMPNSSLLNQCFYNEMYEMFEFALKVTQQTAIQEETTLVALLYLFRFIMTITESGKFNEITSEFSPKLLWLGSTILADLYLNDE